MISGSADRARVADNSQQGKAGKQHDHEFEEMSFFDP
jgi:hypothetical protein